MPRLSAPSKTLLYGFTLNGSGRSQMQPLPRCPTPEVAWQNHWPQEKPWLTLLPSAFGPALVCHDANTLYALHFAGDGLAAAQKTLQHRANNDVMPTVQAEPWIRTWEQQKAPPGRLVAIGTPFQHHVWQHLLRIPRGWLTTYGAIAAAMGKPGAARAVGNAVGQNPLGGWIPCHRVLPATGLGHYHWGGAAVKQALLHAEGVMATR